MKRAISNRGFTTTLALVLFALAAIGAGVATSQRMKNALLTQDALETAHAWTAYVARENGLVTSKTPAPDVGPPGISTNSGESFRYRLLNPKGELIFDSGGKLAAERPDADTMQPEIAGWSELLSGQSLVRILRETVGAPPPTYADVFVPIIDGGKAVGVVEVNLNQTLKAERFDKVFRITALVTVALIVLGVGVPGGLLLHNANARRRVELQVDYLDHHDSLTGLVNRNTFADRVSAIIAGNDAETHKIGVLSIGIDGFKSINDSLGHHVGDLMLTEISDRLRTNTRDADIVGRMTGDEFSVVAPGFATVEELVDFAVQLRTVVAIPMEAKGNFLNPSISIGIATSPENGQDADLLIKRATVAQNWAKTEKLGSIRLFDKEMDAAVNHRFTLETDMQRALDEGQFRLLYQPQIDLRTGDLVGCEALVRWQHPELGLVSPDRFVPIAERNGLIHELGAWILNKACEDAVMWPKPISVAVNLSPAQFANGAVELLVSDVLKNTGLASGRLEVEITEGLIINDTQEALDALHKITSLGVSVAMDDFGTGYSSLSYLTLFPYTKLKIDRSLLLRIDEDVNVASVIRSMVDLGKSLDMKVVCEGVETFSQAAALAQVGCNIVQGYLFAKPMPNKLLVTHLRADAEAAEAAEPANTVAA